MRGCVFAETFESQAKVEANGGVLTGSPTIDDGATIDCGSGEIITYGDLFKFNDFSFFVLLKIRYSSASQFDIFLQKRDGLNEGFRIDSSNSSGNLRFLVEDSVGVTDTIVSDSSLADGALHTVLCVCDRDTDTLKMYVDGVLQADTADISGIGSMDSTANMVIGETSDSHQFELCCVKMFKNAIPTTQEAQDFHDNSTYDYMNDTVVDLPMGAAQHDPVNNRTLDVSGNGLHGTLGDGDGGSTTPTKSDCCGYDFDGSDDYITLGNNALLRPTDAITVSVLSSGDDSGNDEIVNYRENAGSGIFAMYQVATANCGIKTNDDVSELVTLDAKNQSGTWVHSVLTFSRDDQEARGYVNALVQADIEGTSDLPLATELSGLDELYVGAAKPGTRHFDGRIKRLKIWDKRLTPLQVADLHIREMKQINDK